MPAEAVVLDLYFPDTENISSDTIDDIKDSFQIPDFGQIYTTR